MAPPRKEPPWPSALPPALLRWARARGLDADGLAARFDLPADVESRDDLPVTTTLLGELVEHVAQLAGEPALGLKLPAELPFRRYGLAELAARSSATVRDAFQVIVRFAPLLHPNAEVRLEESGGEARFRNRARGWPRGLGRHLEQFFVAKAVGHVREQTGRAVSARRVWFVHARPTNVAPIERHFGTRELDFGREDNGVALPIEVLDWPVLGGDPRMHATAVALAEAAIESRPVAGDIAALVGERLRALLPDGANVEVVAGALHMSPRTLQRRLEDAGTRFSDVLDGVRETLAREWVKDPRLPLGEIGFRLGFADLATFSRAFKRWTGHPPGRMRRQTTGAT